MLSELQRKTVWEGWLSAEIRADYFADLSWRYQRRQGIATWLMLFTSSGAFVTFLGALNSILPKESAWLVSAGLSLFTAVLSGYSLIAQNPKRAIDSTDLHFRWNKLAIEYQDLWDNMYADDARAKLMELVEKDAEISKAGNAFPAKERMLLKWQKRVEMHHSSMLKLRPNSAE